MRTTTLILTIIFFTLLNSKAQTPEIISQANYGGMWSEAVKDIKETADSGFILTAYTYSEDGDITENKGITDYWVLKLDTSLNLSWQKTYGGSESDSPSSIHFLHNKGFIVTGHSDSRDGDVHGVIGYDFEAYWIVSIDPVGDTLWTKTFGGSSREHCFASVVTNDSAVVLIGSSESDDHDVHNNYGQNDIWIVKLNLEGDTIFTRNYGGSHSEEGYAISLTNDNGYILAGHSTSDDIDVSTNNGGYDAWLVKIDSAGNILSENSIGGSEDESFYDVIQTSDGGFAFTGKSKSSDGDISENNGNEDLLIVKTDENGNLQWQKTYGGSETDEGQSIVQTSDNGYLVAGYTNSTDGDVFGNHGNYDCWLLKLNPNGDTIWTKCLGSSGADRAYSVLETYDHNIIIAGHAGADDGDATDNNGMEDVWVVKLKETCYPPEFLSFATPAVACEGEDLEIIPNLQGKGPHYFQWQKDGANIPGTTASPLVLEDVTSEDEGLYRCIITNACGEDTSDNIAVTVNPSPALHLGKDTSIALNQSLLLDAGADMSTYEWSHNDNNGNDQTLLIDVSNFTATTHTIWAKITNSNGCINTDTINVTIKNTFGIKTSEANNKLAISPNPAKNFITVRCNDYNDKKNIIITDCNGKTVYNKHTVSENEKISINDLQEGIYIVKVMPDNTDKVLVGKFVKE